MSRYKPEEMSPLRLKPFRLAASFLLRTVGSTETLKVPPQRIVEALMAIREEHPDYEKYVEEWGDSFDKGEDNRTS